MNQTGVREFSSLWEAFSRWVTFNASPSMRRDHFPLKRSIRILCTSLCGWDENCLLHRHNQSKKKLWCLHCCWVQETSLVQIKSIVSFKRCHHSNVYFTVSDPGPFRSFSDLVYFVSEEGSGLMAQMVLCVCVGVWSLSSHCLINVTLLWPLHAEDRCDFADSGTAMIFHYQCV